MRYSLLGPFEVMDAGAVIDLGSTKQRALLAMLAIESNHVVATDRLVDQLWGENPPPSAIGSLHAYISNLRRALEPDRSPRAPSRVLVSKDPGYLLVAGPDDVDAVRFERLAGRAHELLRRGQPQAALAMLEEALGMWRGPVLADFAYESFAAVAIHRLEQIRHSAAECRIDAMLQLGRHSSVISDLEEMVEAEPLRERRWGQLMVALYRGGRQADALRAYQRARTALVDALGIDPGPELQAVEQAILLQDRALLSPSLAVDEPDVPELLEPLEEAPAADALIGRAEELQNIDEALDGLARGLGGVLLVTGEPGVGKSALLAALELRAAIAGYGVGVAQSPEGAAAPPLWPWMEVFRRLNEDVSLPLDIGPSLFHDLLRRLRKLITTGPVVIILDDLQWADELSNRFLQFVLASIREEPLLLAVAWRDPSESTSEALLTVKAALITAKGARRISLRGLGCDDVAALATKMAGGPPSAAVVEAVHQRTSGNPFFVTELVRLLRSEHALQDVSRMNAAGLPQGARDVIARRLTRLPEQAATVLRVAAVLGPRIDIRLIEHITGVQTNDLLDLMEIASVAGLVSEDQHDAGVYRFNHELVRDALYESIPGLRRARLHAQALDAVVAVRGNGDEVVHELANHALAAVPHIGPDAAVDHLALSARLAQRQLALELSERQVTSALALLADAPETPDRRHKGSALETRMASIAFHSRGSARSAATHLRRARALCPSVLSEEYLDVVLAQGALSALWGDLAGTIASADEGLAAAIRFGDEQAQSDVNYYRGLLAWTGKVREGLDALTESITVAEGLEANQGLSSRPFVPLPTKRALRSIVLALLGDRAAARRDRQIALDRARHDGGWSLSWSGAFAALSGVLTHDADDVLWIADAVPERGRGLQYIDALMGACSQWASAIHGAADPARFDAERDRLAAAGDGLMAAPLSCVAVELHLSLGDVEAARALLAAGRRAVAASGAATWDPELDRLQVRIDRAGDGHRPQQDRFDEVLGRALTAAEGHGAVLFAERIRADLRALGAERAR